MSPGNISGNLIQDNDVYSISTGVHAHESIEAPSENAIMGTWLSPRLFGRDGHFSPALQLPPVVQDSALEQLAC